MRQTGAIVSGRRLFNVANAWGGKYPMGVPVVVVTHSIPREWNYKGSPFTFVTDGVEAAIEKARQIAQDKDIGVGGADMAGAAAVAAGLVPASEGGRSGIAPTRGAATSESGRTRGDDMLGPGRTRGADGAGVDAVAAGLVPASA